MAKLYPDIHASTSRSEYQRILMKPGSSTDEDDYIEVNIFGTFNRNAIDSLAARPPKNREDRLMWEVLKSEAAQAGIAVEEV